MNAIIIDGKNPIGESIALYLIQDGYKVSYYTHEEALHKKNLHKLEDQDLMVNLFYYSIFYSSLTNIDFLQGALSNVLEHIDTLPKKPSTFVTMSSIAVYNDHSINTEFNIQYKNDYISKSLLAIEETMSALDSDDFRVIVMRLPVVAYKDSIFSSIMNMKKMRFYSNQLNAKNFLTWVSLNDLQRAFVFLLKDKKQNGVFNVVSTKFTNIMQLNLYLRAKYGRSFFRLPSFVFAWMIRNNSYLFDSYKVQPKRLLDSGFEFEDKDLDVCLDKIV